MQVTVFSDNHRTVWSRFIETSANGTLFHRHEFLDYHPVGRFQWHHLIFGNPGEPIAVLPGAIHLNADGVKTYRSPSGATLGGFAMRSRLGLAQTVELVRAFLEYARDLGLSAIVFGTVPSIYWREPDDTLEFVLRDAGFTCTPQLMFYVPLQGGHGGDVMNLIPGDKRYDFRKSLQQGLELKRAETAEEIAEFYEVLSLSKAAHEAKPTHTRAELLWLKEKLGERLRILCAAKCGMIVAGVQSVEATPSAWYTQYIADRPEFRGREATRFALLHTLQSLMNAGVRFLDLGPSVQLPINRWGGASFKQSAGGLGCERREWTLVLSKPKE